MKTAKLEVTTQGVKGKAEQTKETGKAVFHLNDEYKHYILVDAFQGFGENYKRREENYIEIGNNIETYFRGTMSQLLTKLKENTM